MKIRKFAFFTEQDLLNRIKKVKLVGFNNAEVYRDASLEIVKQDPRNLVPAQRYVLKDAVARTIGLYETFLDLGVDIFRLRGGLMFWTDEMDLGADPIPLIPPVVEESHETFGTIKLINDGMHRVYAAKKLDKTISTVLIKNVPVGFPYYAFPLSGWQDVSEITMEERNHPDYQKKNYRIPDNYKALFRNFNEVLPGVQAKR